MLHTFPMNDPPIPNCCSSKREKFFYCKTHSISYVAQFFSSSSIARREEEKDNDRLYGWVNGESWFSFDGLLLLDDGELAAEEELACHIPFLKPRDRSLLGQPLRQRQQWLEQEWAF